MNFDKLPCDIKRKIFDCNREAAQIENNKKRYDEVMGEMEDYLDYYFNYVVTGDRTGRNKHLRGVTQQLFWIGFNPDVERHDDY